jgi:predicted urease superfamily metal-dependent hydrolase
MRFDQQEYERKLQEARLELAVFKFDPKLHPRDLQGRFREVLDDLSEQAKEFGVDLQAYTVSETDDDMGGLKVGMIKTQEGARREGRAGQVMREVTKLADQAGIPVVLTPGETERKAMSKTKLTEWYKSLGFKPNKGRNKDYRFMDAMIRKPQS